MKIALLHDWLTDMGGSEQVALVFCDLFPNAPLYVSVCDKKRLPELFSKTKIITSFLQKLPRFLRKNHRNLFPLYPFAFENFDFKNYDMVLSSTVFAGKGIITGANTKHICYCHTSTRYFWEYQTDYTKNWGILKKVVWSLMCNYLRLWDFCAAQRVDFFIANSTVVQERIKKTYRKESVVIHPPVRCREFMPSEIDGDYYLCFGRLVEYKRIDLAVKACAELGKKLIVVGEGGELKGLKKFAESFSSIRFLGRLPDQECKKYLSECKALLFPGEEDFGIIPVETMSCGKPVIAFGKGGALDTVADGKTGILFGEQTTECLKEAIVKFEQLPKDSLLFNKQAIREHALKFDESIFKKKIKEFVEGVEGK